MSGPIEGLDTDGKKVVKVVPHQVKVDKAGNVIIDNKELREFIEAGRVNDDAHVILMGSDCGCKCCC